ncbi:unnamed protein product [Adineta steineri]|uniref:G-protein coupled receptors family 1 profile domain-containing protein n=1 Tax=Adineta steineri TaxID=433720 RepID=A0A813UGQ5_9BILA|nr:unnamed protein product [Adineta steineri]
MDNRNECPMIYQGIFSNPYVIEHIILILYLLILIIGLVGNIMTIIIIKYNAHLRTPTNFYLLNLAVSDLMILMCNLPLEMLEIYNRQWPLSIVFCKLRSICAEFFTCSSILTILAFTCERYFAIVRPIHLRRLSHFRRSQTIIIIIWLISLGFSLPVGLLYEVQNNHTESYLKNSFDKTVYTSCKACVPKPSFAKLLPIIFIITSICFFYFPMIIIGAIYIFIVQALRRVSKYEECSNPYEISTPSHSSISNKEAVEIQQHNAHINSYTWLKIRARCQARKVVVKTLVAVASVFFMCYAPLYLQRLLIALTTLTNSQTDASSLSNFMAYLYVISGITFNLGSVINPILYNVVSNKYRRAFRDLVCCRLITRKKLNRNNSQTLFQNNRSQKKAVEVDKCNNIKFHQNKSSNSTKQQLALNTIKKPMFVHAYSSQSKSSAMSFRHKLNA